MERLHAARDGCDRRSDDASRPSGDGDTHGLSGVYENGPLTVQGYYQSREFDNGLKDTDSVDEYDAGAQYRLGAFRVAASYAMADTGLLGGGSVEHGASDSARESASAKSWSITPSNRSIWQAFRIECSRFVRYGRRSGNGRRGAFRE